MSVSSIAPPMVRVREEIVSSDSRIQLHIVAEPGVETFVVDHQLVLVGRGVGRLDLKLQPGIYKLKFRAGNVTREQFELLEAKTPERWVTAPPMLYSSAIPLAETRKTHEYHIAAAERESRKVHGSYGRGAQLFVLARAWTEPSSDGVRRAEKELPVDPGVGFTLRAADGSRVANFQSVGARDLSAPDPWMAANVELAPGVYAIRVRTPQWGTLEQSVVVCEGWQTQVFVLQRRAAAPNAAPRTNASNAYLDLPTTAMLMCETGAGFSAERKDFRLADLARIGLAYANNVLTRDVTNELLDGKFQNPLLGILGAHALVTGTSQDRSRAATIVRAVREVLGWHPDLDALSLALDPEETRRTGRFNMPPMLARSWGIILQHDQEVGGIVPPGSPAARISPFVWGSGAWLLWQADRVAAEARKLGRRKAPPKQVAPKRMLDVPFASGEPRSKKRNSKYGALSALGGAMVGLGLTWWGQRKAKLTDIELSLLQAANELIDPKERATNAAVSLLTKLPAEHLTKLSKALGVPQVGVQQIASNVLAKLRRPSSGEGENPSTT